MNETVKRALRAVHNALVRGVREQRGSAYMSAVRAEMDTLMGEVSPEKVGPVSPEKLVPQQSRAQLRYCRETNAWGIDGQGDRVFWHDGGKCLRVYNSDGSWTPVELRLGEVSPEKVGPVSPEKPEARASRAQLRYCRETNAWGIDGQGDRVFWHDGDKCLYVYNSDGTWTPVELRLRERVSPEKLSPEKLERTGDGQ